MSKSYRCALFALLAFPITFTLVGCETERPMHTGDNYAPVTAEQLVRAKFSHRTGGEGFDFDWSFEPDTFVIEGNDIPPDLSSAMLGPGAAASRIEGKWRIRNGTIHFIVDTDDAGGEPRKCSMPIYFTGVIRIETPAAQYVF